MLYKYQQNVCLLLQDHYKVVGDQAGAQVLELSLPLGQDEAWNTAPSSVQTLNCSFPSSQLLYRDSSYARSPQRCYRNRINLSQTALCMNSASRVLRASDKTQPVLGGSQVGIPAGAQVWQSWCLIYCKSHCQNNASIGNWFTKFETCRNFAFFSLK